MRLVLRGLLAGILACGAVAAGVAVVRQEGLFGSPGWTAGPYVALGDSYTAGPRIPGQTGTPAGCERSDRNYPALVARALDVADFRDVSCSGATVADLSAAQETTDGVNPAQLSALSARTRLVTVGIGGNDIGFSALVEQCVKWGLLYYATGRGTLLPVRASCRDEYVVNGTDEVGERIRAAGGRLSDALGEVRRRSPDAHVFVVGYPAILPPTGAGCDRPMAMAPADVVYLHEKEQQLNDELRARAEAAGAGYVDTYGPSAGHDACAGEGTRWIEPLMPVAPAAAVHPNERGEQGMAGAVLGSLR